MWLLKDERRLLAAYYRNIGDIEDKRVYHIADLCVAVEKKLYSARIPEYGDLRPDDANKIDNVKKMKHGIKLMAASMARIGKANRMLSERRFICIQKHQSEINVIVVSLTIDGYDLGRRYSSWFNRSGLLFQEYRNHWVWLILSFLGGMVASLLITIVKLFFEDGK